ncbi:MAG: hypothetical protein JWQ25_155, partial [Daejeonella sp.]|nr:hypothetical protein [Daejeonella sp.]
SAELTFNCGSLVQNENNKVEAKNDDNLIDLNFIDLREFFRALFEVWCKQLINECQTQRMIHDCLRLYVIILILIIRQ